MSSGSHRNVPARYGLLTNGRRTFLAGLDPLDAL